MPQALLAGVLTVFFDVAYQSYVPGLIGSEQLVDGNGKLGATQSFAQVAGPGLGGALFGFLRAGATSADAVSYGVSSASMLLIRAPEPERTTAAAAAGQATRLRTELLAGPGLRGREQDPAEGGGVHRHGEPVLGHDLRGGDHLHGPGAARPARPIPAC